MRTLTLIVALCISYIGVSQDVCGGSYVGNGTTQAESPAGSDCFVLQEVSECFSGGSQQGSLWCDQTINVSSTSFTYCYDITTRSDENQNGDGFTFTLQTVGTSALGGSAVDIGYGGIGGSSFTIEWDGFDNPAGGLDDGPCGTCLIGFQYDDDPDHGGSYTDSEGFTHNELDADQHACCTGADYWNDTGAGDGYGLPTTNTICFIWDHISEMFTVTVNGTTVLGPSKVDLAVLLGTGSNITFGLTTACGGEETGTHACAIAPTMSIRFAEASANYVNNNVRVDWAVAKSDNISFFEVQRSRNGIGWENIEKVYYENYATMATTKTSFEYHDYNADVAFPYYRIVEYDNNESITIYSEILTVNSFAKDVHYTLIQAESGVELFFMNTLEDKINVKVYSASGMLISNEFLSSGNESLFLSSLKTGIYMLSISTNDNIITHDKIFIK